MLDNMLTAHARDPFEGPRKVVVAMAQSYRERDAVEGAIEGAIEGAVGHSADC
jgi:hypothetical protein